MHTDKQCTIKQTNQLALAGPLVRPFRVAGPLELGSQAGVSGPLRELPEHSGPAGWPPGTAAANHGRRAGGTNVLARLWWRHIVRGRLARNCVTKRTCLRGSPLGPSRRARVLVRRAMSWSRDCFRLSPFVFRPQQCECPADAQREIPSPRPAGRRRRRVGTQTTRGRVRAAGHCRCSGRLQLLN
jgi:hypothetical protein